MKHVVLALVLMGCAAATDDESYGVAQRDVSYQPTFGFRDDLSSSNTRCLMPGHGLAQHQCNLSLNKTASVQVTGVGMTIANRIEAEQMVDGWVNAFQPELSTWYLKRNPLGVASDVYLRYGRLPNGGPTTSIHTYAHAYVEPAVVLEDFGSDGVYQKFGPIDCVVDRSAIIRDFEPQQEPHVLRHAIDYCALKSIGIGSGGHPSRSHSIVITPDTPKSPDLSPFVRCLAQAYSPSGDTILPLCVDPWAPCPCLGQPDN